MAKLGAVIKAQQFDKPTIEEIFKTTKELKGLHENGRLPMDLLKGKIMISFFEEESTRTRFSFESAILMLGGNVVSTENAKKFSSLAKGGKMEREIKVISHYGDVIVLRQSEEGEMEKLQNCSKVPIINAGDGPGQHPTQALLDLFTIQERFGKIEKLKIALVGDLLNGRTVRSLCYFLAKHFPNNQLFLVSPGEIKMRSDIIQYLEKYKVNFIETENLSEIISEIDIFYQTRVQEARFPNKEEYEKVMKRVGESLIINPETLTIMKENSIIMHPMPIKNEISEEVDDDPRAWYFKQSNNGLYVRMAILKMILNGYKEEQCQL